MKKLYFNVQDFGATGIAMPMERLYLTVTGHIDYHYPAGLFRDIYRPDLAVAVYDSVGIQAAVDAAHAQGGGTVIVPPGDYLIAPLSMRSNVELHLQRGACLWGSPELEDYFFEPAECWDLISDYCAGSNDFAADDPTRFIHRLISARDAENFAITGGGQISAQSGTWFIPWLNSERSAKLVRPKEMFVFKNCRRVAVKDIRIVDSAYWTLLFHECDNVLVDGIELNHFDGPNADGIDLSATSNVRIANCKIHCTDDAVCMKNVNPDFTMRNIVVSNCIIRTLCNGVKIGTESWGNFSDIAIDNLVIANPDNDVKHGHGGINLNSMDGGRIDNVRISNIVMRNVECPIYIIAGKRTKFQSKVRTPIAGKIRNVAISHVSVVNSTHPCLIAGQPENPPENLRVSDIYIEKTEGIKQQLPAESISDNPEAYPRPTVLGENLPAYGWYIRNAHNVKFTNCETSSSGDVRDEFVTEFTGEKDEFK